ncbi:MULTISPECIES: hypothetical protein [unclassified Janthinobacterium]|uniref:hypothetical protein n=1 Tax=unclassified Janthinobacterium TaxID=2610881 RepID=UPI001C592B08|nr:MULTISPECIES: hypothetical protein [unclassified Janthinobacterium]QYG08295.1 hypothetical protein KY494_05735 [Janthinobacterium sp. PAMC25594]
MDFLSSQQFHVLPPSADVVTVSAERRHYRRLSATGASHLLSDAPQLFMAYLQ